MRIEHRFQLAHEPNAGVCCDESGLSVGGVPLFVRASLPGGGQAWRTLSVAEINDALGEVYGLPIDVASKVGGLAAVARALDGGEVARAQILALHLRFPDPLDLSKAAGDPRFLNELAARLKASDLLKADWNSAKHPRWPADSPDSIGGQFAPAGTPGVTGHVVARFRDGPPRFISSAGAELSDGVYRHPVGGSGDVSEFDAATGVFGPPNLPKFKPDPIGDIAEITAQAADSSVDW